ncbi:MAG: hypothetical protein ACK5KR_09140 [Breznakia sp.]
MKNKFRYFKCYALAFIIGLTLFYPAYVSAATAHAKHYAHLNWRYGRSFNIHYLSITSETNWTGNIDAAISGWNSRAGSG